MKTLRHATLLCIALFALATGLFATTTSAEAAGPNPVIIMETTVGRIIVMLDPKAAPVTVENFLRYVDAGFYDGTVFHRVLKQEKPKVDDPTTDTSLNVVQGGGYAFPLHLKQPLFPPIPGEDMRALQNKKGTIAMARTQDPDSATCQFFFNVTDNPYLNPFIHKKAWGEPDEVSSKRGYTAFGRVIRGWEVVEKIQAIPTKRVGMMDDVPTQLIVIKKMYRAQ